ncbi:MAG: SurA N-terminal domain-containing protein [Candidatus Eisenbacteria bacterium]
MLQSMRENTKIILWIVIAAFVGLIFAVWGADLRSSSTGQGRSVVGKVNGRPVTVEEYERAFNEEMTYYRGDSDLPVLPEITEFLRGRAWERVVNSAIVEAEMAKANIVISDEEIVLSIRTNPPDFLRKNEAFLTGGQFDYQKYRAAIDDPGVDWRWLEGYFRDQLPYNHFRQRVAASARVTEGELRDLYVQNNETVDFQYVGFLPGEIDETPEATDEEIGAWYDGHGADYRVEPRASLDYVTMKIEPSEEDYQYLRNRMEEIKQRVAEGTPFEELARYYSEGPTAQQGGEIGVFRKGQLTPELEAVAFDLDAGKVSDVIEGEGAYQIIQVAEKTGSGSDVSVRLRQIFLNVEAGGETVEKTRLAAEDLRAHGDTLGGLRPAAQKLGYEVRTTPKFEEGDFVPGLGEFRAANLFAHAGKVGDISVPIYQENTYYIFEVAASDSSQVQPLAEVRSRVREEVIREKKLAVAKEEAERFAGGESLEGIARRAGREVKKVDLVARAGSVPGIGRDPRLILAAFASPEGEVGGPFHTKFGSFFVRREKVNPIDEERYLQEKGVILRSLLAQRQEYVFTQWLEGRRNAATIEDLRPEPSTVSAS